MKLLFLGMLLGVVASSLEALQRGHLWQDEEATTQAPFPDVPVLFCEEQCGVQLPTAKEQRVEKTPARDEGDENVQLALRHSAVSRAAAGGFFSARRFFLTPPPRAPPVGRV